MLAAILDREPPDHTGVGRSGPGPASQWDSCDAGIFLAYFQAKLNRWIQRSFWLLLTRKNKGLKLISSRCDISCVQRFFSNKIMQTHNYRLSLVLSISAKTISAIYKLS